MSLESREYHQMQQAQYESARQAALLADPPPVDEVKLDLLRMEQWRRASKAMREREWRETGN